DESSALADEPQRIETIEKAEPFDFAARARSLFAHPSAAREANSEVTELASSPRKSRAPKQDNDDLTQLSASSRKSRAPKPATREDGPPAVEEQAMGLVRALKAKR